LATFLHAFFLVLSAASRVESPTEWKKFKAQWVSRPDIAGTRLYMYAQLHEFVQLPQAEDYSLSRQVVEEDMSPFISSFDKLVPLPRFSVETDIGLANGFFGEGFEQSFNGFHITHFDDTAGLTEEGGKLDKELADEISKLEIKRPVAKPVSVELMARELVTLPTIFKKEHTIKGKLADPFFQEYHFVGEGDDQQVQLTQIGLGIDIRVTDPVNGSVLWEQNFVPGKWGNAHITIAAQRTPRKVLESLSDDAQERLVMEFLRAEKDNPVLKGDGCQFLLNSIFNLWDMNHLVAKQDRVLSNEQVGMKLFPFLNSSLPLSSSSRISTPEEPFVPEEFRLGALFPAAD